MEEFKMCGYCFSRIEDGKACPGCTHKLFSEVESLKKENKILNRCVDLILQSQGLQIDRPNAFIDNFLGTDVSEATLRIRRVSSTRV